MKETIIGVVEIQDKKFKVVEYQPDYVNAVCSQCDINIFHLCSSHLIEYLPKYFQCLFVSVYYKEFSPTEEMLEEVLK